MKNLPAMCDLQMVNQALLSLDIGDYRSENFVFGKENSVQVPAVKLFDIMSLLLKISDALDTEAEDMRLIFGSEASRDVAQWHADLRKKSHNGKIRYGYLLIDLMPRRGSNFSIHPFYAGEGQIERLRGYHAPMDEIVASRARSLESKLSEMKSRNAPLIIAIVGWHDLGHRQGRPGPLELSLILHLGRVDEGGELLNRHGF